MGWKKRGAVILAGILLLFLTAMMHQFYVSKVSKKDSTHAVASGSTFAHRDCERVYVRIYLDKSSTGTGGWGNVNYWTGTTKGGSTASVSSGSYKITQGRYYRAQGAHSVTQGGKTEATNTCTDALYIN